MHTSDSTAGYSAWGGRGGGLVYSPDLRHRCHWVAPWVGSALLELLCARSRSKKCVRHWLASACGTQVKPNGAFWADVKVAHKAVMLGLTNRAGGGHGSLLLLRICFVPHRPSGYFDQAAQKGGGHDMFSVVYMYVLPLR